MYAIKKVLTKQRVNNFNFFRAKLKSYKINIILVGKVKFDYEPFLKQHINIIRIDNFTDIYTLNLSPDAIIWVVIKDTTLYSNEFLKSLLDISQNIDMIYFDEEFLVNDSIYPYFKPAWSPYYFYFNNIGNAFWIRYKCLKSKDSQYDYKSLLLSFIEYDKNKIKYHSGILSHSKVSSIEISNAEILPISDKPSYKGHELLVSIIILTKDKVDYLKRLIESIISLTSYKTYEIIIVDHNSEQLETSEYFNSISSVYKNIQVLKYTDEFNYSKMNNYAVSKSKGDYLVFLNNDIEIIEADWIERMLYFSCQNNISIVGAKLLYPNNQVQHCGITIGTYSSTGHFQRNTYATDPGYMNTLKYPREVLALTGACIMVNKNKFKLLGGFNENFKVIFNDVDLCLKAYEKGYNNIVVSNLSFIHYEGITRKAFKNGLSNNKETELFSKLWNKYIKNDPYYNKHFWRGSESTLII